MVSLQAHVHGSVSQEVPGLIPPSLRRALNEAEVSAQRAAHAKRQSAGRSARSRALLLSRHPTGILLAGGGTGNTRDLASRCSDSGRGTASSCGAAQSPSPPSGVYAQAEAAEAARQRMLHTRREHRRQELLQHDNGGVRRGYDLLRPQTSQAVASTHLASLAGDTPTVRSASAQGMHKVDKEGDLLAQLPHRKRIQPWVSDADLALGKTTQQRLFEQPANPPPSAARRQRLIDLSTAGRKHDILSGRPLSDHRRPQVEERRSLRQEHPSMASAQLFTEK